MKNRESAERVKLNPLTVRLITAGSILVLGLLAASTATYLFADRMPDYASAILLSEKLLTYVRPGAVFSCAGIIAAEYILRSKKSA